MATLGIELGPTSFIYGSDAVGQLMSHELDTAIVRFESRPPPGIATRVVQRESLVAVVPEGHPLAGRPRLVMEDLADQHWVVLDAVSGSWSETTRRMWVTGSRVVEGHSGTLRFASVRTEITQGGQVAVVEDIDIVYRRAGSSVEVQVGSLDIRPPPAGAPRCGSGPTRRRSALLGVDVQRPPHPLRPRLVCDRGLRGARRARTNHRDRNDPPVGDATTKGDRP